MSVLGKLTEGSTTVIVDGVPKLTEIGKNLLRKAGLLNDPVATSIVLNTQTRAEAASALTKTFPELKQKFATSTQFATESGAGQDPIARMIAKEAGTKESYEEALKEAGSSTYDIPKEMPEETQFKTLRNFDYSKYKMPKAVAKEAEDITAPIVTTPEPRNLPARLEDIPEDIKELRKQEARKTGKEYYPTSKASEKSTIILPETLRGLKQVGLGKFEKQPIEEINASYLKNLQVSKSPEEAAQKTSKELKLPESITPKDILALTAVVGGTGMTLAGGLGSLFGDRNTSSKAPQQPAVKVDTQKFPGLAPLNLDESTKSFFSTKPTPPKTADQVAAPAPASEKPAAPTATPVANTPADARKEVKQASKTVENEIANIDGPKKDKDEFKERLAALQQLEDDYWNEYKTSKNRVQFLQAMEFIGQAVTSLGAGLYGYRTGMNLSGLKFDRADWNKQYDLLLEELKQGLKRTESAKDVMIKEKAVEEERTFRAGESAKDRALRRELAALDTKKQQAAEDKQARTEERMAIGREFQLVKDKLAKADNLFGNKETRKSILANEDTLRAWASDVYGEEAANVIVKKAKEGEWFGIDSGKAIAAMAPYNAQYRQRQEELVRQLNTSQPRETSVQSGDGPKRDKVIEDYANQHLGGNYDLAKSILERRGYKEKQ